MQVILLAVIIGGTRGRPVWLATSAQIVLLSLALVSSKSSPAHLAGVVVVAAAAREYPSSSCYNKSNSSNYSDNVSTSSNERASSCNGNSDSSSISTDGTRELAIEANEQDSLTTRHSLKPVVERSNTFGINEVSSTKEPTRVKRRVPGRATSSGKTGPTLDASTSSSPEFAAPIGNVSAVLGRDVRLVCTVNNLGQHQGFYQCQVNTNPRQSMSGYLEVVVPPTIIEPETSQVAEVVEHSNASIQCKASGHPPPTISWRREDGEPIKLSGSNQMKQLEPGASTQLANNADKRQPALGDGGGGVATTSVDRQVSREAATESLESPSPSRYSSSSHLNDIKSDKLSLINVDRTMAGLYVCTASNGIPNQVSRQIPVYVKFPPKVSIEQGSSVVYANLGDHLELNCLIEAFPKPTIYWSGRQLAAAGASSMSSRSARVVPRQTSFGPGWYLGRRRNQQAAISLGSKQALHVEGSRQSSHNSLGLMVQKPGSAMEATVLDRRRQRRSFAADKRSDEATSNLTNPFITSSVDNDGDDLDDGSPTELERETTELIDSETVVPKSANEQLMGEAAADASLAANRKRPMVSGSVQQARLLSAKSSSEQPTSPVMVSQTAVNAYTYKLKMTIARVRPSDYGEYVCIATNSMGTSSARVQVKGKAFAGMQSIESMGQSIDAMASDNQADYQRDSLISETTNSLWTNQMIKVSPANGFVSLHPSTKRLDNNNKDDDQTGTQYMDTGRATISKPAGQRQTNRVYDENYLQTIRNRQSSPTHGYLSPSGKLQQKLMLTATSYGEQQHQRNSATKTPTTPLVAHLLLITIATCWSIASIWSAQARLVQLDRIQRVAGL